MIDWRAIRQRWQADGSKRDERGRRLFAASEARAAGWGGLAVVSSVTGLARTAQRRGIAHNRVKTSHRHSRPIPIHLSLRLSLRPPRRSPVAADPREHGAVCLRGGAVID